MEVEYDNDSKPVKVTQIYNNAGSVTASVISPTSSYGPTIVNGAMVYFVDSVFTAAVLAEASKLIVEANRNARRSLPRSQKGFPLTVDDLTKLGFTNATNPLSRDFEGCFFQPNTPQLVELATTLIPSITTDNIIAIRELIDDAVKEGNDDLKTLLTCAVNSFVVPSANLDAANPGKSCDNISGPLSNLETACAGTELSFGTGTIADGANKGLVYVNEVTLSNPSRKRNLLEIKNVGEVEGESQGGSEKSTFFDQDADKFVASPAIAKQIENGALGLVPSVLVVALSVLCAFSL